MRRKVLEDFLQVVPGVTSVSNSRVSTSFERPSSGGEGGAPGSIV
ncbi:MAG: hypothetical protein ACC669_05540 [bacterium]